MEALFALLQTSEGLVLIELLTVVGLLLGFGTVFSVIVWLFKDTREGRRGLHQKIEDKAAELHARIDEGQKEVHDHMLEDAKMWGKITAKLGIDD